MNLTGKQRSFLRGLGHNLSPVVLVGKEGLTNALASALDTALETHELVKVKIGPSADPELDRHVIADELAARTSSQVAQVLGKMILLYRRRPTEPTIQLP
jgi:RNA-binding protein